MHINRASIEIFAFWVMFHHFDYRNARERAEHGVLAIFLKIHKRLVGFLLIRTLAGSTPILRAVCAREGEIVLARPHHRGTGRLESRFNHSHLWNQRIGERLFGGQSTIFGSNPARRERDSCPPLFGADRFNIMNWCNPYFLWDKIMLPERTNYPVWWTYDVYSN